MYVSPCFNKSQHLLPLFLAELKEMMGDSKLLPNTVKQEGKISFLLTSMRKHTVRLDNLSSVKRQGVKSELSVFQKCPASPLLWETLHWWTTISERGRRADAHEFICMSVCIKDLQMGEQSERLLIGLMWEQHSSYFIQTSLWVERLHKR